jgi:hypothetical protein
MISLLTLIRFDSHLGVLYLGASGIYLIFVSVPLSFFLY